MVEKDWRYGVAGVTVSEVYENHSAEIFGPQVYDRSFSLLLKIACRIRAIRTC